MRDKYNSCCGLCEFLVQNVNLIFELFVFEFLFWVYVNFNTLKL